MRAYICKFVRVPAHVRVCACVCVCVCVCVCERERESTHVFASTSAVSCRETVNTQLAEQKSTREQISMPCCLVKDSWKIMRRARIRWCQG